MHSLTDKMPQEIADALGLQGYQGTQIFRWLHKKQTFDFDAMTDLSKELRRDLHEKAAPRQLEPVETATSREGTATRKMLFRVHDGETVESVLLKDRDRLTFCLSSQVGCAVKCSFCATGLSGFTRNLNAGEIVEQALHLAALARLGDRTPNIVYMGMGEPFRNYDAVTKSIRLLMTRHGLGIGARKITVSTAGDVPGIRRFAQERWQVRLSVSLHAGNDTLRSQLVPLNRKYPLAQLVAAIADYQEATGRQITFEWALLRGVNDSLRDAAELAALAGRLKAAVNVIPYNPVAGLDYEAPDAEQCETFRNALERHGIPVTLRRERGQDIDAACGQLRRREAAAMPTPAPDLHEAH